MEIIFSNICNISYFNAFKFTKEGSILVKVEKEKVGKEDRNKKEDVIVVSVKDTGMGIDSDIMLKLFTKFTTKTYHGTGLGLFISKSIIEAHGGRMWAENNTDGKRGATFSFSLPIS
jgi:two-component system, OmpR family, sensor histidine kinase VicK